MFAQRRHQLPGAGGPGGGVCEGLRERLQGLVAPALHLRGKNCDGIRNFQRKNDKFRGPQRRFATAEDAKGIIFIRFTSLNLQNLHLFPSVPSSRLPSSPASSRLRVQYPAAPESPSREAT